MKVKRYKRVQKYLTFYKNKFAFRAPYQVLIDGTFCQISLQNKVNISDQMPKYLSESVKLLTTVCVVEETQRLSQSVYGAMLIVKQFPIRRCGHEKSPIEANECLRQLICDNNNADHYMLATQDPTLSRAVKEATVCPLIYLKGNTIVMEKPDDSVKESVKREDERCYNELTDYENNVLKQLKKKHNLEETDDQKKGRKRRKGPKGPNPLSCKKRKVEQKPSNSQSISGQNRKRKRKRGSKHIQRMFDKIVADFGDQ